MAEVEYEGYVFPNQQALDRYLEAKAAYEERGTASKPPVGRDVAVGAGRGAIKGAAMPADLTAMVLNQGPLQAAGPAGRIADILLQRSGVPTSWPQATGGERLDPSKTLVEASGLPKPQTGPGRFAEEGVAGAVSGMMFPGSTVTNALTGAGGGLGAQAAAEATGDNPIAKVAGALLGSTAAYGGSYLTKGLLSMLGLKTSDAAKQTVSEAMKGTSKQELDDATRILEEARGRGVSLTPAQAFPEPHPIHQIQERVSRSAEGAQLNKQLAGQTKEAAQAGRGLLGGVPEVEPTRLAKEGERAATDALNTAEKMRGKAVAGDYATAFNPAAGDIPSLRAGLEAQIKSVGATTDAGRWLQRELLDKIPKDFSVIRDGPKVQTILQEARDKLANSDFLRQSGIADKTVAQIKKGMTPIEDWMNAMSVNRPEGNRRFAEISKTLNDPLAEGPLGVMAGKKGAVEGNPPAVTRVLGALNSDKIRAQTIEESQRWLSHEQPGLFAQLAKQHVTERLEKAFGSTAGAPAADAPGRFAAALWGTEQQSAQRENFRAMIAGAARDLGVPEGEAVRGAEKLMQVMEAAGRAKGGMGAAAPTTAATEALVVRAGPGSSNSAQVRMIGKLDELLHGREYQNIADMLTSREGMKQLREWAKFDIKQIRWGGAGSAAVPATNAGITKGED